MIAGVYLSVWLMVNNKPSKSLEQILIKFSDTVDNGLRNR